MLLQGRGGGCQRWPAAANGEGASASGGFSGGEAGICYRLLPPERMFVKRFSPAVSPAVAGTWKAAS